MLLLLFQISPRFIVRNKSDEMTAADVQFCWRVSPAATRSSWRWWCWGRNSFLSWRRWRTQSLSWPKQRMVTFNTRSPEAPTTLYLYIFRFFCLHLSFPLSPHRAAGLWRPPLRHPPGVESWELHERCWYFSFPFWSQCIQSVPLSLTQHFFSW